MKTPDVTYIAERLHELTADRQRYLEYAIVRRKLLTDAIDLMTRRGEPVDGSEGWQWLQATREHLAKI